MLEIGAVPLQNPPPFHLTTDMTDPALPDALVLDRLFATIEDRKGADPSTSWTAKLLSKGPEYICKKVPARLLDKEGKGKGKVLGRSPNSSVK